MNRYWKLISIVLITVFVIGFFYIQSSTAMSNNPEFIIKKVSGSDDEGKKLSVFGEYITQGRHQDTVRIDEQETIYTNELSYIESLNGVYNTPEIKLLQRNYRNFMRGKELNPTLFYEDEAYLAYANIEGDYYELDHRPSNFTFELEVLDKESKEVTSINETLPKQKEYSFAYVVDVQKLDDKLKVLVQIESAINQSYETVEEIHIYTFDLKSQTLIGDDIVVSSGSSQQNENSTISNRLSIFNDLETIQPQHYLLIEKVKVKEVQEGDESSTEEIDQTFTLYNYETNEHKELFNEKQQMDFENIYLYGSTIYFINITANGLEILPYQIENRKFSTKQTIDINIPERLDESGSSTIKLKNNRMYVVSPYKDLKTEAVILVADLKTWKTVYEGAIEATNSSKSEEDYTLRINSLNIE
ncbi:hypothetical protein [Metabacillus sp. Hm71]|uniref:hypothetical protein n=1 Tax=Metabacillus sp. Hm71 TaxID=3450743 RepID=UPI003F432F54